MPRPSLLRTLSVIGLSLVTALLITTDARAQGVEIGGALPGPLPLFPSNNWWNLDVSQAPLDPNSPAFINFIQNGGRRRLHPDFGGDSGEAPPNPIIYGVPYVVVPGSTPLVPVTFYYDDQSDVGAPGRPPGYPIPEAAKTTPRMIEGGLPGGGTDGDRHLLLVDRDNRLLYELFATYWNADLNRWEAGSGAVFPLDTNLRRPDTWTSADAAGLAILPGLIRYDEVHGTDPIRHAFRVTVRSTNGYVHPASHRAGSTTGALPMGARLRLKAATNISGYPPHIQRIFQAMKTYGLIVADNGSDMYITGTHDARWSMDAILSAFRSLYADSFEVVQLGWNPAQLDTDSDGLPDEWETQFGLNPNVNSGTDGPTGDADNDGLTNLQEFGAGSHPRGFERRYFAEGVTAGIFDTRFALVNPTDTEALALLRFQAASGGVYSRALKIGAKRRATVEADTVAGLESAEFATLIESDADIAADRTVSWDGEGYGSHAETSVGQPQLPWFFAEGATHSGFDLFYLLQNSETTPANVNVTFLRPAPLSPLERAYQVPAMGRLTIWVNLVDPELAATDVSAVVQSTNGIPVIAERAMYLTAGGQAFAGGHASAGVSAPKLSWFLAEGATGTYFDTFVLIANPEDTAAALDVDFLTTSGVTITRHYTVGPRSRFNVWVDIEDPLLADAAVSTVVRSTNGVPVIVERAMWWPGPTSATWREAHNATAAPDAGVEWILSEGQAGSSRNIETFVLMANVSTVPATVRLTLLFEDADPQSRDYTVTAQSRWTVNVTTDFPAAMNRRFGAVVESVGSSPAQVIVERAMYSDANGAHWAAGTSALGTRRR